MNMKSKGTALLLILILTFTSLTACGEKNQSQQVYKTNIKIGVTLYDQYDVFLKELMEEFYRYLGEQSDNRGLTITVVEENAAINQSIQNSQVREMMENGCDVVCVNLIDRTDAGTIIELSKEYNVPIIFFNRELVPNDLKRSNQLYYVGAVVEEAGIRQGKIAAKYYVEHPEMDRNEDGVIQYYILEGEQKHQDAISRTKECVAQLDAQNVKLEKVGTAIANWSRDQARTKIEQLISSEKQVELLFCNNDNMALGAIDAYTAAEIPEEEWPAIFGIDAIHEGLVAISENKMQGTVKNDIVQQADGMLDLAIVLSGGMSMEDLTWKPDENRCIRSNYLNITPDSNSPEGYAVWE